jgi:nucleoside-diphosphate-sugar epimerase
MPRDKILVTGGNGFIGSSLVTKLLESRQVVVGIRDGCKYPISDLEVFRYPIIDINTDWNPMIEKVKVVVHTAARAHIIKDNEADPLKEFRNVNVEGALNLGRQAAKAGVKRFIFISSIGVNGNINSKPFTEQDSPDPSEAYAVTKWEAEAGLLNIAKETSMEVVIIRPPLVYGANAPGNFRRLVTSVNKGIPLPLGSIHNKRTLVALDNLVDLINTCIDHPAAANQVFLAGDDEDVSTTLLLQKVGLVLGKPARLINVPPMLIKLGAAILGKSDSANSLLGNLQVDISKARELLGWEPPITIDEGIKKAVKGFLN